MSANTNPEQTSTRGNMEACSRCLALSRELEEAKAFSRVDADKIKWLGEEIDRLRLLPSERAAHEARAEALERVARKALAELQAIDAASGLRAGGESYPNAASVADCISDLEIALPTVEARKDTGLPECSTCGLYACQCPEPVEASEDGA